MILQKTKLDILFWIFGHSFFTKNKKNKQAFYRNPFFLNQIYT